MAEQRKYKYELKTKDPEFKGSHKIKCPKCKIDLWLYPYHKDIGDAIGEHNCPECNAEIKTLFTYATKELKIIK